MPTMSNKSVAEKLQVKPGRVFLLIGAPTGFDKTLGDLPSGAQVLSDANKPADIIQLFAKSRAELERELPRLKELLNPAGALWVTYYKGTSKQKTDINRDSIAEYASSIGLEGVAIISVDDDWSALRLKRVD
jgi:hypothetical protein